MNKKTFGMLFISISILISFSNLTLIGAVIGTQKPDILSFVAIAFFIAGIALIIKGRLEDLAKESLSSRTVITDPRKIRRMSRMMGYKGRNVKEGYQVLNDGIPITVIPNHQVSAGVYRSIMKALSTGESNFRRYSPSYR